MHFLLLDIAFQSHFGGVICIFMDTTWEYFNTGFLGVHECMIVRTITNYILQ